MNILFVYSQYDFYSTTKPMQSPDQIQFGISYISSLLKKHGHQTRLLVLSSAHGKKNRKLIDSILQDFKPRLIGFTTVSTEYDFIADTARYIRQNYPELFLFIGGPHVSLNSSEAMLDVFDALCIGEGEYATLELVSQLEDGIEPSGIENLWIKSRGKIEKNQTRPFITDLDSLPFPDRDIWQEWIDEQPDSRYSVLLGRGCPYQCTYCINHAFKKVASGSYVRIRSVDNIMEEIRDLAVRFPKSKEIYLEVETFGVNTKWAIDLCSRLEQFNATIEKPMSFGANVRITRNTDFDGLFAACKKGNFEFIAIGLESGSERVRREILKRNYSNKDVINAVKLAKKYGLKVLFYNIIGIPGETKADFEETVKMNRICMPDYIYKYIFYPYPGTDLHSLCIKWGLIKEPLDKRMERRNVILDLPGFSKKKIQHCYTWFEYYVYKGRKPILMILAKIAVTKCTSNIYMNNIYNRLMQVGIFKRLKAVFTYALQ